MFSSVPGGKLYTLSADMCIQSLFNLYFACSVVIIIVFRKILS